MGTKERRERERQETRDRILDAAREMFVKDGVEAVTMRAIAQRIEYTPTAIYHHFEDKEALIRELAEHDARALGHAFQRIGRIEDPVERLRRIGRAYLRFGLENPNHYRFLFMTPSKAKDEAKAKAASETSYGFLRQTVAEAIETGRLRPELTDPDQVALMCWAIAHGIVSLTIVFQHGGKAAWEAWPDPLPTGDLAIDGLMRGLLRGSV
jgi:AcrR family transcriptional regulator